MEQRTKVRQVVWVCMMFLSVVALVGCPGVVDDDATITDLTISDLSVPVFGEEPVSSIDADQYSGTVKWEPDHDTFASATEYTASVTLTPREGYTLKGVAADTFTVDGADTVTHDADSGEVTAVFPDTWGEAYTSANIGTLVYIPAGSFQRDDTATNISEITQPYRMSEHEITRSQFEEVMATDPSDTNRSSGLSDPVHYVSWYDAITFANKLSIAEGLTPVYSVTGVDFDALAYEDIPTDSNGDWNAAEADWDADGYRLPTEMEWMWAAMGADQDSYGDPMQAGINRTGYSKPFAGYDGSNNIDDYAWYGANSEDTSHPVGNKLPNELGLYDMTGNVCEWVWDLYVKYPSNTKRDYTGSSSGNCRVFRGGSWIDGASLSKLARRIEYDPQERLYATGFRLVRQ